MLTIIYYGFWNVIKNGELKINTVYLIHPNTWTDAIGFSAFSYEGMAVILPVSDITAN
jgi:hypothetical protein